MEYIQRRPDVGVRIVRPDYSASTYSETPIFNFVPRVANEKSGSQGTESDAMTGYSYQESTADHKGAFTLTLLPEASPGGISFVDSIQPMDLVFIHEFGKDRYCGVVRQVRYSARMSDSGPNRAVLVSGGGIGELLASFQLIMDYYLWVSGPNAAEASGALTRELVSESGGLLGNALKIIYKNYIKLATLMPGDAQPFTYGVKQIIDHFVDTDSLISSTLKCRYNIAMQFFQQGVNSVWDIWRRLLPAPIYELFGIWNAADSGGKYSIVARQSPFDPGDWKELHEVSVNPLTLISYDVGVDDSEVRTFFYGSIPGSETSRQETLAIDHYKETRTVDEKKWPKYGYRPLDVELRYFNRSTTGMSTAEVLEIVASMMKRWYSENDRFLSGTITMVSIDDPKVMEYAHAGDKLLFLGGEFYIEKIRRTWAYGGAPQTELSVTRGFQYSDSGEQTVPISNLGRRLLELERNKGGVA